MNSTQNKKSRKFMTGTALALVLTATAFGVGILPHSSPVLAQSTAAQNFAMSSFSFADLVEEVRPAVVSVRVKTQARQREFQFGNRQFPKVPEGHPLEKFLDEFGERLERRDGRREQRRVPKFALSQGSGFVVSADGFVVTNNHVVEDAIEVTLIMDDGTEKTAEIIGTDPRTDLALLKIEGVKDLPFVEFAEKEVRVGDWVVAIGNPFGLGGSVTTGIVSARGRDINSGAYDDYIQIDAAVNRGNSGGPAFNLAGKVVGVNTAIFSPNGGNVGIAFAIPASQVQQIINDLKDDGKVTRGWLGVQIQAVSQDIADSLGLEEARGALVTDTLPGTPAETAGVEAGDVILEVNGEEIEDNKGLIRSISKIDPNSDVTLDIWRDGKNIKLQVTLGRLSENQATQVKPPKDDIKGPALSKIGLALEPNENGPGLVVTEVEADSPAQERGLIAGDILLRAGNVDLERVSDLTKAVKNAAAKDRKSVLVKVERGGNTRFVGLPITR